MCNRKQKTFSVQGKKIKIISRWRSRAAGFDVWINGIKFFNTGFEQDKQVSDFESHKAYYDHLREIAEDRCYKKWLDKNFSNTK